jgi:hypothetical protein
MMFPARLIRALGGRLKVTKLRHFERRGAESDETWKDDDLRS